MTEYQRIGSKYMVHELHARILPEHVLLADMIANVGEAWPRIHEEDYRSRVDKYTRELIRIG